METGCLWDLFRGLTKRWRQKDQGEGTFTEGSEANHGLVTTDGLGSTQIKEVGKKMGAKR
jgi:hypothetical protein